MNLNEKFPVTQGKIDQLLERMQRLGVNAAAIEEQFSRGGGKGGQKINKTSNRVTLKYPPLELTVNVQRERQRSLNRFLALRELVDQIEMKISPETSQKLKEIERIRKQKNRRWRRYSSSEGGLHKATDRVEKQL